MEEIAKSIWDFIIKHPLEIGGFVLAFFSLMLPIYHYLGQKRLEEKDKRFKNYHELIEKLAGANGQTMLDRQIAIVFELRNYPEYFEVTRRILEGLLEHWLPVGDPVKRLLNEINITLTFINRKLG